MFSLVSAYVSFGLRFTREQVGSAESENVSEIKLSGEGISNEHCFFESHTDGSVFLNALPDCLIMVNGQRLKPNQVGLSFRRSYSSS